MADYHVSHLRYYNVVSHLEVAMRAKECIIFCDCEGQMFKTSLKNPDGKFVTFWITEDEYIYFRGLCAKCGHEIEFRYSIIQMLFDCPKDRRAL